MSERVTTRYNYKDLVSTGLAFSEVEITDAGVDANYLTDLHAFLEEGFSLNTQADGNGTNITDFVLSEKNSQLTKVYGKNVYEKIQITNVTYQTGTIYATGYYSGDVNFAEYFNNLQGQIDELLTGTSKMLLSQLSYFPTYKDRSAYGLLAFTHDSFSQANYQGLFDEIGHIYNSMHVEAGGADLSASSTLFYATPIPGYYERGGTQDTVAIDSTTDVDASTELITLSTADYNALYMTRGVLGTGANGVPVRLKLVSGALPNGLAIDTTYFVRFKTTPDIELYDTEAHSINTASTTGRVGLTDAVGTFKITQEGIVLDDAFQGHWHDLSGVGTVGSEARWGNTAINGNPTSDIQAAEAKNAIADSVNGTPRTSNETRPKTFISFGYIKAEHVTTSGEPISALRYDTGWIANSDWTDFNLIINHGLSAHLSNLEVEFTISEDGTDATSFRVSPSHSYPGSGAEHTGYTYYEIDNKNIEIQTGRDGVYYTKKPDGLGAYLDTESWYYKVVITKPNLVATYADTSFRKVYDISDATDYTFTLPDASTQLTEYNIKRTGAGAGTVTVTASGSDTIEGSSADYVIRGDETLRIIPNGTNWAIVSTNEKRVCKAWVNFDGTTNTAGKCTIRDSYNVSSVDDLGTGKYQVNLINAMSDTNYSIVVTSNTGLTYAGRTSPATTTYLAPTTTSFIISNASVIAEGLNAAYISAQVFGS